MKRLHATAIFHCKRRAPAHTGREGGRRVRKTANAYLNVNNVPDLVDGHTLGDSEFTSLTEVPCEHVPGTPSKTMCTTHDESV